jgi:predicted RNase H-like HicB family nuclease
MYKYEVIIYWSEEDQVFIAEVPELPGCVANGDSPDRALASCQEAMDLWLDTARVTDTTLSRLHSSRANSCEMYTAIIASEE